MNRVAIPAFTDNDIWMLQDERCALLIDPGVAASSAQALDDCGPSGILVTRRDDRMPASGAARAATWFDNNPNMGSAVPAARAPWKNIDR